MKQRFNTYDIICSVTELQKLVGMRVNQVYDIDNKTYLIRLQRSEEKSVLLLESGNRFHTTAFEWPKNVAPSGFSMKLRKHLKNKRLESLRQLGIDRIVDFQFGTAEAAYHVILELYDRGNIILTDYNMIILNILRPHTEGEAVRFAVREKYPEDRARLHSGVPNSEMLADMLSKAKPGDNLRRALNPHLEYGPAVLDHVLLYYNLSAIKIKGEPEQKCKQKQQESKKGKNKQGKGKHTDTSDPEKVIQKSNNVDVPIEKDEVKDNIVEKIKQDGINIFDQDRDLPNIYKALILAEELVQNAMKIPSKGFIIQKKESRPTPSGEESFFYSNQDYHPYLFKQFANLPYKEIDSFDVAVDEFYSTLEGQKIDLKAIQQERDAMKKLSRVRDDHEKRLKELENTQEMDKHRAELITRNQQLVDNAILAVQTAVANQMSWPDISALVKAAQNNGDPIASVIKQLKLQVNQITLFLTDPYAEDSDSENENEDADAIPKSMLIDVDLELSAYANARRYYDQKRSAAKKQQKTIESQGKAFKSAEKKTKQALKEVQTMTTISKARKAFWFEKFYWFISSENYLVIGGRDQQQNELIVKRYLRAGDVYVHADIQGASSIIIKNPSGKPIPPKTLNEAGTMAIAYSVAWEAKVVISSWWVNSDQVSKTAPAGEYLTTGSFMIRGKKNYLPPSQLALGLSFLFKLEDSSIERHKGERRVRSADGDLESLSGSLQDLETITEQEVQLEGSDSESEEGEIEVQSSTEPKQPKDIPEVEERKVTEFPDIELKFDHQKGNVEILRDSGTIFAKKKDEDVVYLGDDVAVLVKPLPQKVKQGKKKNVKQAAVVAESKENIEEVKEKHSQVKRGQKGKLKKMKDKYKDQDEDERQLRMDILQSAGSGKDNKKLKKGNAKDVKQPVSKPRTTQEQKQQHIVADQNEDGDQDLEPEREVEIDMLDSLSGNPVLEDELLFAVPVIAPYNTLTSYKYKVKLTPGTGRRGRAARTAVSMFIRDKNCVQREKDLIKSVKDDMLARNIPGKVKLSAPHLHKHK